MSNTTTINTTAKGSSAKGRNVATHLGAAAAAAGLGVAGTTMAYETDQEEETVGPDPHAAHAAAQPSSSHTESAATAASAATPAATPAEPVEEVVEETQPVATESQTDDVATVVEEPTPAAEEPSAPAQQEPVNPDAIADAIIAEDQVDPNDIDMADVVNFDEIGTVYTVDGESYTAAAFHDAVGNQFVMIDVDNDNTFDVVTDAQGNPLIDPDGNYVSANGITVDDAEMGLAENDTYLPHREDETTDEFGAETIADDLIS